MSYCFYWLRIKGINEKTDILQEAYVQQDVKKILYLPELYSFQTITADPVHQNRVNATYELLRTAIENFNMFWQTYSAEALGQK